MAKFRKKPVVINAYQLGSIGQEVPQWFNDRLASKDIQIFDSEKRGATYCYINTLEGIMRGDLDDYIILGVKGEVYPCKPDIFKLTYEAI